MNMYYWIVSLSFFLIPNLLVAGQLYGPHNHGTIDVVVYKNKEIFEFEMITPSLHIVGFESAPSLSEEKMAVRKGRDLLKDPKKLFKLLNKTQCQIDKNMIDVSSEMLDFHRHKVEKTNNTFFAKLLVKNQDKLSANASKDDKMSADVHSVGVDGHSDFRMYYKLTCETYGELSLQGFFNELSGIKKINFHAGDWTGDTYLSLTPEQPVLNMTYFSDSAVSESSNKKNDN